MYKTDASAVAYSYNLLLLVLLFGTSLPLQAKGTNAIGKVLTAQGLVEARDANGLLRALTRRSEVFEADTILVGADGFTQVRMVDDAQISLQANTEFSFNTYAFDANSATPDSAAMSMIRGGFRTISGTIGDADEDGYRLDTPYASIGIRGTAHSGVIVAGVLYTGVSEGGTTVSNNQGSVDAGIGADYDFTETRSGESPRGLLEAPAALAQIQLTPAAAASEENEANQVEAGNDAAPGAAAAGENRAAAGTENPGVNNAGAGATPTVATNSNTNNNLPPPLNFSDQGIPSVSASDVVATILLH